jgi:ubiquinone/menaquinone biosynthesis C-methylase UbiE
MTIRNSFLESPEFSFQNNIFYHRDLPPNGEFEILYLSLREKENRLYPNEIVKNLPEIPPQHPLRKEWISRKFTLHKLLPYLNEKKAPNILEVGCGNGWLCRHLASLAGSQVVGMDVNETELLQGARIFSENRNLLFAYADVEAIGLPDCHFDYIIFSASIQYFNDIEFLFDKLSALLADGGEIHIIDSPIYREDNVVLAHRRSEAYFSNKGFPMMAKYYYHHTWQKFARFNPVILYDPDLFLNRIKQKFSVASPFPWLKIMSKKRGSLT